MIEDAYAKTPEEVLDFFKVDAQKGLTSAQARQQRSIYGPNEMVAPPSTPFWKLVLKQFEDLLVLILLGAAVVSLILGFLEEDASLGSAIIEPSVIMIILIANAIVGVYQESSAEEAIEKLKEYEASSATVLRDGSFKIVERANIYPGDIVKVQVGDKVPADCRVIRLISQTIRINQSTLTGENMPVMKIVQPIPVKSHVIDQDKLNILFSGTLVASGSALAVVCLTGRNTSMGKIQASLESEEEEKTPLGEKLDEFAELLSKIILGICITVWLINIGHFADPEHGGWLKGMIYYFKIAVALAVAAIPEGLPAVVTTCLALGTMKMAKRNAIVRSLPSVETLGCTTVICSDKTGTLTTNKMCVQQVMTLSPNGPLLFDVKGDDYSPKGDVFLERERIDFPAATFSSLAELAKISVLCNESSIKYEKGTYCQQGIPTEGALKTLAEKLLVPDKTASREIKSMSDPSRRAEACSNTWRNQWSREALLEFTRDRKSMGTFERNIMTRRGMLAVKGAPESLLDRCSSVFLDGHGEVGLTQQLKDEIMLRQQEMSSKGLRVLACCYRNMDSIDLTSMEPSDYDKVETGLTFVGLTGIIDPPRSEVVNAIEVCYRASIRVVVITGDNKTTAESICRKIGIFTPTEDLRGRSYTGSEFMALSESEQNEAVRVASLFSRVEPNHKLHLVKLLRGQGEVVAMTGDGVNDAPALKHADIGVAMGSGTAVAREASDMILADDNFSTIVVAVEEGRAIYANTKQFIRYLISSNIGEVACIFITAAIGAPEALIPVQLLWVNLVTDGLPATALGFNKPDPDIMMQPPRGRTEKIINSWTFFRYMFIGLYIGFATVGGFVYWYLFFENGPSISYEQLTNFHKCGGSSTYAQELYNGVDCSMFHDPRPSSISLSILVTIEMFNTFNALSENQSLLVVPPWANVYVILAVFLSIAIHCIILYIDFFIDIFKTAPLTLDEWTIVINFSLPVIFLDEFLKFFTRQIATRKQGTEKKDV